MSASSSIDTSDLPGYHAGVCGMRQEKNLIVVIGKREISDPIEIREDARHIGAKEGRGRSGAQKSKFCKVGKTLKRP